MTITAIMNAVCRTFFGSTIEISNTTQVTNQASRLTIRLRNGETLSSKVYDANAFADLAAICQMFNNGKMKSLEFMLPSGDMAYIRVQGEGVSPILCIVHERCEIVQE